jgi:DNA modification methylase
MDPCCGSGTTGEAALRHGCAFVGIDVDPEAIRAASARLVQVEHELAPTGDGPRLAKGAKAGKAPKG